jgi:NADH-quinone oxidoreductase subunit D
MFVQRTRGIGLMNPEKAEQLGVVGPTARASGLVRDIRVEAPYAGYATYPVNPITETAGDLEARFTVRIKELFESYRVIREILDNLPVGELTTRMPRKIKEGEAISRVEAPRGELFYYLKSNGSDKPERIHVRTPTLSNMASVLSLTVGRLIADIPMILVGIDPCFSCNDRMVVLNHDAHGNTNIGDHEHWTWENLRQYGIDYYKARFAAQSVRQSVPQGSGG